MAPGGNALPRQSIELVMFSSPSAGGGAIGSGGSVARKIASESEQFLVK